MASDKRKGCWFKRKRRDQDTNKAKAVVRLCWLLVLQNKGEKHTHTCCKNLKMRLMG